MNNLKFRAYFEQYERMINNIGIINQNMILVDFSNDGNLEPLFIIENEIFVMQSTGLKDKKGKEIFEGDIVVGKFYFAGVGYFDTGERDVVVKNKPVLWEDGKFVCCGFDLSEMNEEVEIIGNIYENKELLR